MLYTNDLCSHHREQWHKSTARESIKNTECNKGPIWIGKLPHNHCKDAFSKNSAVNNLWCVVIIKSVTVPARNVHANMVLRRPVWSAMKPNVIRQTEFIPSNVAMNVSNQHSRRFSVLHTWHDGNERRTSRSIGKKHIWSIRRSKEKWSYVSKWYKETK